jgi:peptidoglycan biosynthesis protein MviN/MurJ (putative lipid II flippase)
MFANSLFLTLNSLIPMDAAADSTQKIVKLAGTIGAAVIACFLIYGLVKDGIAYSKGQGSIAKIVGKVLFLLVCIVLIVLVQTDVLSFANKFSGAVNGVIDQGLNMIPLD